jgi:hypothetical protein
LVWGGSVNNWDGAYQSSVGRVQSDLDQMRTDFADYRRNGHAANVWADRDNVQKELDALNGLVAGITDERALGPSACYDVIKLQNSALNASFALMFAQMSPRPQVGARHP